MTEIKLNASEVMQSMQALGLTSDIKLPANVALQIGRLIRELSKEVQIINDARIELANRHGSVDESGEHYNFKPEKRILFDSEFSKLMATEITLVGVSKIKLKDLTDTEEKTGETILTPAQAINLEPLLDC
jgi:hypothetical protein